MRWVSAAGATLLGGALLMAESGPEPEESLSERCGPLPAFKGAFDYITDCETIPAQGHVSIAWDGGYDTSQPNRQVVLGLAKAGMTVTNASVTWDEQCAPAAFTIGTGDDPFQCESVSLPVYREQHVSCSEPDACTLIVRPAPPE